MILFYNIILLIVLIIAIILVVLLKQLDLDENIGTPQELFESVQDESVEEVTTLIPIEDSYFLPILNFHNIGDPPTFVSEANRIWYVRDDKLREALQFIKDNDLEPIFLSELVDYLDNKELPDNAIVLTFDDGAINFYTNAAPLLREFNFKSNVLLMTGVGGSNYLGEDHIKELFDTGLVEFQSHTRFHQYLTRIPLSEQRAELERSKEFIEELLGTSVEVVAYPFGLYDDTIIELAKDIGYKLGLTIKAGHVQDYEAPFEIRRFNVTNFSNLEKIIKGE